MSNLNTPALTNKKILVSGASAAGPALAYWLDRYGFDATIVERHPTIRPGGYAIDVRGSAIHISQKMGILEDLQAADTKLEEIAFYDDDDKLVASMDRNFGAGGGIAGDLEVLRDDLARILYNKIKNKVTFKFGNSIAKLTENTDGMEVEFESGEKERYDLVIGADGTHSNVRHLVFGEESQFAHFWNRYISVFTIPNYRGLYRKWDWHMRPGFFGGIQQYGDNNETRGIFLMAGEFETFDSRDISEQKAMVRRLMSDKMAWEIPRLLDEMDKASDFYFDSASQIKMPTWSKGRVSLVGDAAAGPTAFTGQGTSAAMVMAYVLAGELAEARGDYKTAFKRYEEVARPFADMNQNIIWQGKETQIPNSWDEVREQLAGIDLMKAGTPTLKVPLPTSCKPRRTHSIRRTIHASMSDSTTTFPSERRLPAPE
ncbi:FAD-dependent urate hydroxylase (plasmid) [Burkholderia glumae]|uniref:FAD-dependent monooxygenase n=2 Tax=Burkholderia glumae TaxID=337 RepID=UPI002094F23B|nr:FAD-dependent monooxygenase [Burkholderia glumae]QKM51860.1 FAD-dependent urate hydroxylase [Burkholderia glumae]